MSSNILVKNESDAISGFYYDQQIQEPTMVMALFPNKIPDPSALAGGGDRNKYWKDPADTLDDGYSSKPIAVAIVNEDFQIGVANQFDDNSITDDATQLFNQIKPLGVYAEFIGKQFREGARQVTADNIGGSKVAGGLNKLMSALGNGAQKVVPYLNRALVIQGSRFSTYNGSGVAFGNLSMKFTLFSDWTSEITQVMKQDKVYEYGKSWKWKSCIDKVSELIPYCIGKYLNLGLDKEDSANAEFYNTFIGWQLPPGGYKPELKNLDNIQEGTLKVMFAGLYSINNLVISDAQFNFSKQRIKVPNSTSGGDMIKTAPMYCDVQLTLKPASKYSDVSFEAAIKGESISGIHTAIDTNYNTRLSKLMK